MKRVKAKLRGRDSKSFGISSADKIGGAWWAREGSGCFASTRCHMAALARFKGCKGLETWPGQAFRGGVCRQAADRPRRQPRLRAQELALATLPGCLAKPNNGGVLAPPLSSLLLDTPAGGRSIAFMCIFLYNDNRGSKERKQGKVLSLYHQRKKYMVTYNAHHRIIDP